MSYAERRSAVVSATLWAVRSRGNVSSPVLPDGCMDIIWDGEALFVAGPDTRPHDSSIPGVSFTGIRFDPGVAPGLLGVPAATLRDQLVRLDQVWPSVTVDRWCGALSESADDATALERLVSGALTRSAESNAQPWVTALVQLLRSGNHVDQAAHAVGFSEREMRRRSNALFGYGPKMLQRILRVNDATRAVARGFDLSDAAARYGYADYPHLHRETQTLLSRSPASFRPAGAAVHSIA